MFPSSVEQVTLTRTKQGQQKTRPKFLPGHDTPLDPNEPEADVGVGGAILDIGRDGAARLDNAKGLWGWDWIKRIESSGSMIQTGEGVLLYPRNRSLDPEVTSLPPTKIANAAVDYVRALPDVSEYASISDLIVAELAASDKLPKLDVYRGDVVAAIYNPRARVAKVLLAFPVGEVGNHLNVSPFLPSSNAKRDRNRLLTFRPSPTPIERFPTEILQICSSLVISGHKTDRDCTCLLVRVETKTHMLNIDPHRISISGDATDARSIRVGELSIAQTEGRRHVDMALDETSWSRALVVDEGGGVWLWAEEKVEVRERVTKVMKLRKLRDAVSKHRHGFFRVAFGSRPGTALVVSARLLVIIDFESESIRETTLLEVTGQGRMFVTLEKTALSRRAHYTCVATNYEIMWIDELKVGPPALTWKHDFASGTTGDLSLHVCAQFGREYTILASRRSHFALVFEVDENPPARSRRDPRTMALGGIDLASNLRSMSSLSISTAGPTQAANSYLAILATDGSLHSFEMLSANLYDATDPEPPTASTAPMRPLWSETIKEMHVDDGLSADRHRDWQDRAATRHKILDLRWVWQEINAKLSDQEEAFTFSDFEQYLRELDAPFDNFTTLSDLARDALAEHRSDRRTHALVPMSIHPESFKSDLELVTDLDTTKYSLFPIITPHHNSQASASTTPAMGVNRTTAVAAPGRYDELLSTYTARNGLDTREKDRIQQDTQRLVLDLILSRTVVHSEDPQAQTPPPPQRAGSSAMTIETPEDLFQRTQDLTLDEQPKIEFRHLIPREMFDETEPDSIRQAQAPDKDPKALLQSSSARQLLGEWQIGSDPSQYSWSGWRDPLSQSQSQPQAPTPHRRPVRPLPSPRAPNQAAQSQPTLGRYVPEIQSIHAPTFALPPTVRPLTFQSGMNANTNTNTNTNARSSPPPVLQSSQAYPDIGYIGPSTQVERGPFGGRLETKARKKPAKKRVGGF